MPSAVGPPEVHHHSWRPQGDQGEMAMSWLGCMLHQVLSLLCPCTVCGPWSTGVVERRLSSRTQGRTGAVAFYAQNDAPRGGGTWRTKLNAKRSRAHGEAGQRRRVRGGAASERAHSPSATPAPDAVVQEAGVKRVSVKTYKSLPLASHAPHLTKGRRPKKRWAPSNGPEGQVSPRIFFKLRL